MYSTPALFTDGKTEARRAMPREDYPLGSLHAGLCPGGPTTSPSWGSPGAPDLTLAFFILAVLPLSL